jgi:hypothetical protein
MDTPESLEVIILTAAQRLVDRGALSGNGMPTANDILRAEAHQFGHLPETALERHAFRSVVAAIQRGEGNAWTDPEPLLAIVAELREERG